MCVYVWVSNKVRVGGCCGNVCIMNWVWCWFFLIVYCCWWDVFGYWWEWFWICWFLVWLCCLYLVYVLWCLVGWVCCCCWVWSWWLVFWMICGCLCVWMVCCWNWNWVCWVGNWWGCLVIWSVYVDWWNVELVMCWWCDLFIGDGVLFIVCFDIV